MVYMRQSILLPNSPILVLHFVGIRKCSTSSKGNSTAVLVIINLSSVTIIMVFVSIAIQ